MIALEGAEERAFLDAAEGEPRAQRTNGADFLVGRIGDADIASLAELITL